MNDPFNQTRVESAHAPQRFADNFQLRIELRGGLDVHPIAPAAPGTPMGTRGRIPEWRTFEHLDYLPGRIILLCGNHLDFDQLTW